MVGMELGSGYRNKFVEPIMAPCSSAESHSRLARKGELEWEIHHFEEHGLQEHFKRVFLGRWVCNSGKIQISEIESNWPIVPRPDLISDLSARTGYDGKNLRKWEWNSPRYLRMTE